jgi:hypothetical protein
MKFFRRKQKKKKLSKEQQLIEKEFNEGKIILPTEPKDYADLKDFRKNTLHLPEVQKKLDEMEVEYGLK